MTSCEHNDARAKSRDSARTAAIAPLLRDAVRVLLLSGTPALSRPAELFPQVSECVSECSYFSKGELAASSLELPRRR